MIRILHTIDTTGPGGAETVFVNLVKGLDRQKYEPVVVIRGAGWLCNELKKNGISPLFINSKGSFNFNYLMELVAIIRRYNIDIVQSHLLGSNLYCSFAGIICGVPVVSTFHGFVDIHANELFSTIKSTIINRGSARLVFVSNKLRDFYVEKKGFSARKSVTIYNGVDTSYFKPQRDDSVRKILGLGLDNVLVGSVGNIRPSKGYEYLLKAAKLVVNRYPHFRFVVVGEGSGELLDNLMDLRINLKLENHLFFHGFMSDIPRFLNNLDIFVLPSVSEGFSISTIEAMACGVPVIATRSGGPEEIIRHLEDGILVDINNSERLAESLIELNECEVLRNNFIARGIECINENYSATKTVECYSSLYSQL